MAVQPGVERRQWFRLPITLKLQFRVLALPEKFTDETGQIGLQKFYPACVRDISGGGLRLGTSISLPAGTLISIKLPFLEDEVVGKVVYRIWSFTHGVKFLALETKTEQAIVSYILQEQGKRLNQRKEKPLTIK